MDPLAGAVAFFDIGNTLASVSVTGGKIELAVYPYVPPVLEELQGRGVRLGIVSDRGPFPAEQVNQALADAGLAGFFEPALVIYGRKDSPAIFQQAAAAAGPPDPQRRLLFVGEDATERGHAAAAGFLVAPHPLLAVPVLEEAGLRYVRVTVPPGQALAGWRAELADLRLLPVHVTGRDQPIVYAITTAAAAARLDDLGFWVDRLGAVGEPLTTELYLLRDDRQADSGFLALDGNSTRFFEGGPAAASVLASTPEGLLVAIPAGRSVEEFHFSGARHGHNLKLIGSLTLLDEHAGGPAGLAAAEALAPPVLSAQERQILSTTIQPAALAAHVDRYSGAQPADAAGVRIQSRHIHHPDNARAVTTLVDDLERIGGGRFTVRRHQFTHGGQQLDNVEAELAGHGLDGIVLVTAHMDATAARAPGYRPAIDPAPGADDDASGTAGVLAAAEAITALDTALGVPRRAVRFVLFNAEEHGLVGSKAYARDEAARGAPIVAVFQMDMIGYDVLPDRTFELHAGFTPSPAVEARSLDLARMIAALVPQASPALPAPQIYPANGEPDLAEQRSDHYSFQLQGYTACLAIEDFFAGPGNGAPPEEPNPRYHMPTDATINADYAADIARLMTAAAWIAATR